MIEESKMGSKEAFNDVFNVKVALMCGKSYLDGNGQDIDIPHWVNCDANFIRRKGETYRNQNKQQQVMLRVRKDG